MTERILCFGGFHGRDSSIPYHKNLAIFPLSKKNLKKETFRIHPGFKFRLEGEVVRIEDSVNLQSILDANNSTWLSVEAEDWLDHFKNSKMDGSMHREIGGAMELRSEPHSTKGHFGGCTFSGLSKNLASYTTEISVACSTSRSTATC